MQYFHPWLFHREISILLAWSFFMGFSLTILGLRWHSYCRFHSKLCCFEPYDLVNRVGLCNSPILDTHIPKGWNLGVVCQEQRYRCVTWVHRASSSSNFFIGKYTHTVRLEPKTSPSTLLQREEVPFELNLIGNTFQQHLENEIKWN